MNDQSSTNRVVVRGAGEMASGVIRRLSVAGFAVVALEQESPVCVRRTVCYAEAVYDGEMTVEGVTAELVDSTDAAVLVLAQGRVPLLIDPGAESLSKLAPLALVDGRMLKKNIDSSLEMVPIVIGLGPGFVAGQNCHAAVETNRGFDLGRVIYTGSPLTDTGVPAPVNGVGVKRVFRSPGDGIFRSPAEIGEMVDSGQVIGEVDKQPVICAIGGMIRGLLRDGLPVTTAMKLGDIDPQGNKAFLTKISHKANAIGGGALEAILALRLSREKNPD